MIWILTLYCAISTPACEAMVLQRNRLDGDFEYLTYSFCVDWAETFAQVSYSDHGYMLEYSCRETFPKNKIYLAPRR